MASATDANSTSLEVRGLVKRFGQLAAVNDVSFEVHPGEVLTLLGPSGCGKTTTLRSVAGFERPDSGEVIIEGQVVVSVGRGVFVPPEKRGLGMVFQNYAIWPHMSVFENVAYPLRVRRMSKQETARKVEEVLDLVGLGEFGGRSPNLLSGGQQQRVALARALVYSPNLLLLDEPLSNLDAKLRGQMRVELKRLQERLSVTMLFVTHDQTEAMSLSTRLAVMNQGHLEQLGTPQEVYESPQTAFVEDFLGRVLRFRASITQRLANAALVTIDGSTKTQLEVEDVGDDVKVGDKVVVAIRPEQLEVHAARDGAIPPNSVRCLVEKALYLGSECELVLEYEDAHHTIAVSRTVEVDAGQLVDLALPASSIRIWSVDVPLTTVESVLEQDVAGPAMAASPRIAEASS